MLEPEVAYGIAVVVTDRERRAGRRVRRRAARGPGRRGPRRCRLPASRRRGLSARAFPLVLAGLLVLALAFLTIPVAAIFLEAGPAELWDALGDSTTLDALRLSLVCSVAALAVIVVIGTPVAYLLATRRFRGRTVAITLIELPLVLPPAVAGLGLLVALGPDGLIGGWIEDAGIQLVFETAGVIVALTFVASPFYVRQAQAAFEALEPTWLEAARTLGDSEARAFAPGGDPGRHPRARHRRCAGLGARAGRIRGDARLRRVVPGDHPDRAARDRRALRNAI